MSQFAAQSVTGSPPIDRNPSPRCVDNAFRGLDRDLCRLLAQRLIEVRDDERARLSQELHDGLAQFLTAAFSHLEASRLAGQAGSEERAATEMEKARAHLKKSIQEARRLVSTLRPRTFEPGQLGEKLEELLNAEQSHAGWQRADLVCDTGRSAFDPALEATIYQVAQESLANIRRHADSSHVRLTLRLHEDRSSETAQLFMEVRDWGRGFCPDQLPDTDHGIGLTTMREAVLLIGGEFELWSAPAEGTAVRTVFPVDASMRHPGAGAWE